jgi:hypothetical protein
VSQFWEVGFHWLKYVSGEEMMTMNSNDFRSTAKVVGALVALGFPFSGWAACEDPSPVTAPSGGLLTVDNYWYTLVGGKVEGCPANLVQLAEFPGGTGGEVIIVIDSKGDEVTVTLTSSTANGPAEWSAECSDDGVVRDNCAGVALVDAAVTSNAKGGNGCLYSFDLDAASATAGDPGNIRSLYLCSDGKYEPIPAPTPPPAVVNGCYLGSGETKNIYGVDVSCPTVPLGEQRTVYIAKDTETNDNGDLVFREGFGFTNDDGIIDFKNICICIGGSTDEILELECNPNPSFFTDPALELLPECTITEGAQPVTEIQIQNPRCVTVGGTRRCY